MRLLLATLVLAALASPLPARAGSVGVLVIGDQYKKVTADQADLWLRTRTKNVVATPLPSDAIKVLLDCFIVDDAKCSRSVIDSRATTDTVISIRVEITSKKTNEVRLTVDWFVKGHNPVTARRTCDECTEQVLRTTLDAMLTDLARTSPGFTGRIKVSSQEPGLTVLLDGATIGVTPIEIDVPAGSHELALVRDGRTGPKKQVEVESGSLAEVVLGVPEGVAGIAQPRRRSKLVPAILLGLGLAAGGAGTFMIVRGGPTGDNPTYTDYRTPGYGVAIGGGALAITGAILFLRGDEAAPMMAVLPDGGAAVGWLGRF